MFSPDHQSVGTLRSDPTLPHACVTRTTASATGVARYLQLYTVLSQALADGSIRAGDALPSEPALVRRYGVSRTTVRRALARLAAEGAIVRRRDSGTFARGPDRSTPRRRISEAIELPPSGSPTNMRLLLRKLMPVPEFLAREHPDFGPSVLLIRKLRRVGRRPMLLASIWIPGAHASLLPRARLQAEWVLELLRAGGVDPARMELEQSAVPADPVAARYLGVQVGAPLFEVCQIVRDTGDRPLAYARRLYRSDLYESCTRIERAITPPSAPARKRHQRAVTA